VVAGVRRLVGGAARGGSSTGSHEGMIDSSEVAAGAVIAAIPFRYASSNRSRAAAGRVAESITTETPYAPSHSSTLSRYTDMYAS